MSMLKEFKEFAMKGNVVDLAVGVVIGAAFSGITKSLVDDVLMPFIGWIFGKVEFVIKLHPIMGSGTDTVIKYGTFITVLVNFLIVAFAIFLFVVKPMNKLAPKAADAPAGPTDVELLGEIRDLLKKK
jgi:large conductance mechanosensitive channel